ncbi:MAG: GerAB/ArcD/ProY family transporter, partial [Epulopiscium sp.]|nr:GerAB/ArcD/ProY family transporter [Candidatus Epulonipiscium sp.]
MLIRNNQISKRQVRLLLILQMFSTPILMLPRVMARTVNQDGWLIPVLGLLVGYVYLYLITNLTKEFPGQTISEFAPIIVGKILGNTIVILLGLKILITTAFELRLLCEIVKQI